MQLPVTCLCPQCGTPVTITKSDAARVLQVGRKTQTKQQLSEAGKKGMKIRWGNKKIIT